MDELAPVNDLLTLNAMPKLADALRQSLGRVVARWNRAVHELLPHADALTATQVRNSIPRILDQMARALASSTPGPTDGLLEITRVHGTVRFHESYNIRELIAEYRILRRILVEEIDEHFEGTVSTPEWMALDMAVDIALQQAVVSFTEHQKEQLRAATDAEARFLAFLAHDMRNSLNSILLSMQWVEQTLLPFDSLKEQADSLRTAREAAIATVSSMERLLQAERLRNGASAKRERVKLATVAHEVVAQVQPAAKAKGITLNVHVPPDAQLWSDAGLLSLILHNLIGNAVKYSDDGAIDIAATALPPERGNAWRISVTDHGIGIQKDKIATLFEAFTRGETHGQPGVGLGLFIASQSARILGSHLEVTSEVGRGSTFSVVLHDLPPDAIA